MMQWIEQILSYGIRRPGYRADEEVTHWAAAQLKDLGRDDVRLEPLEVPRWEPGSATLEVGGDQTFAGFASPRE